MNFLGKFNLQQESIGIHLVCFWDPDFCPSLGDSALSSLWGTGLSVPGNASLSGFPVPSPSGQVYEAARPVPHYRSHTEARLNPNAAGPARWVPRAQGTQRDPNLAPSCPRLAGGIHACRVLSTYCSVAV